MFMVGKSLYFLYKLLFAQIRFNMEISLVLVADFLMKQVLKQTGSFTALAPGHCVPSLYTVRGNNDLIDQGAKKIIFTACHSGKLKLTFTSPDVISTSPKSFLTSRVDCTVLLLFEFLKKDHLPVGQVNNKIH